MTDRQLIGWALMLLLGALAITAFGCAMGWWLHGLRRFFHSWNREPLHAGGIPEDLPGPGAPSTSARSRAGQDNRPPWDDTECPCTDPYCQTMQHTGPLVMDDAVIAALSAGAVPIERALPAGWTHEAWSHELNLPASDMPFAKAPAAEDDTRRGADGPAPGGQPWAAGLAGQPAAEGKPGETPGLPEPASTRGAQPPLPQDMAPLRDAMYPRSDQDKLDRFVALWRDDFREDPQHILWGFSVLELPGPNAPATRGHDRAGHAGLGQPDGRTTAGSAEQQAPTGTGDGEGSQPPVPVPGSGTPTRGDDQGRVSGPRDLGLPGGLPEPQERPLSPRTRWRAPALVTARRVLQWIWTCPLRSVHALLRWAAITWVLSLAVVRDYRASTPREDGQRAVTGVVFSPSRPVIALPDVAAFARHGERLALQADYPHDPHPLDERQPGWALDELSVTAVPGWVQEILDAPWTSDAGLAWADPMRAIAA